MTTTRAMEAQQLKDLLDAVKAMKSGLDEMKAGQDEMKAEMKSGQDEMKASQDEMKAEMKAGQDEMKAEMKSGQDEMKAEMKSGQDEMKAEMKAGQDEMKASQEEMKNLLELKVGEIEQKMEKKLEGIHEDVEKVKERIETVDAKIGTQEEFQVQLDERMKTLEKKIVEVDSGTPHHFPDYTPQSSLPRAKPPTYDGQSVWTNYHAQFDIIAEANNWDERTKACQLAASLRGPAADILQTLPADKRLDFSALVKALELRYGEKNLKETSRIQLRSRRQKTGESLQELASDVEKLSQLAFADCPMEVRESLAVQYFTDTIRDPDVQQAVIMAECKDLNSALAHASKFEIARQASRNVRPVRGATVTEDSAETQDIRKMLKELLDQLRKEGPRRQLVCWTCGRKGHLRRNCLRNTRERLEEETSEN